MGSGLISFLKQQIGMFLSCFFTLYRSSLEQSYRRDAIDDFDTMVVMVDDGGVVVMMPFRKIRITPWIVEQFPF